MIPSYTFEDAVARAYLANTLMHGTDSILRSSVETLMLRGLTKVEGSGDKYTWNADLRLRIPAPFHIVYEQVNTILRFSKYTVVRPFSLVKSVLKTLRNSR